MTTCIISHNDDAHAICVELALKKKGESVRLWCWGDFPVIDRHTFRFDGLGAYESSIKEVNNKNISLWIHRGLIPVASSKLHPADVRFVQSESRYMLDGILNEISSNAFCVNPLDATRQLRSKINELTLAVRCGLTIPPTLFSNDPSEIRKFFAHYAEIILKHSSQMYWESADGAVSLPYTSKINASQLQSDEQISACPSIFQLQITKLFELRIVFMGSTLFAIKIDSQKEKESIDWRKDYNGLPPCSLFELPKIELDKIKIFIKKSGLLYGSIDVIVDKFEKYIFLEVNETGQFLWIEDLLPEIPLLDCFTNFLISRDSEYKYKPERIQVACGDFNYALSEVALTLRREGHAKRINPGRIVDFS